MEWLFVVSLCINLFLLVRLRHLKQFLHAFTQQVGERKAFLFIESGAWTRRYRLDLLTRQVNALLEESLASTRQSESYFNQIDTMLRNLAEAVLIVNSYRKIVLANPAARELLELGPDYRGLRMESVLNSSSFTQYMDRLSQSIESPERQTIEMVRGKRTLFFEVVGAPASNPQDASDPLTIFILHDITRMTQLERLRKDFVANVSHELRTPVTVIKGFAETLIEDFDVLSRGEHQRFLEKIQRNTRRLNELLEDLLLLSRLESGRHHFDPEPCDVNELIREFAEGFAARLEDPGQHLVCDLDPALGTVKVDATKIHQVLQNLLDNALRYARGFTRLRITTYSADETFTLAVEDDGCGIPPRDLPHIFERFYRVDKGRSRDLGGTGLGLSIVKHIATLHGGDVRAKSALGHGLRVELRFPRIVMPEASKPSVAQKVS